jgi:G3E family GTPase
MDIVATNQLMPCVVKTDNDSDDEAPDLIALMDDTLVVGVEGGPLATTEDIDSKHSEENNTEALPLCPVTILSGFLGSGKTTLIQYILKSPDHGKRIAVIENEFGEGLAVESLIARDGVDPQSDSLQDLIELPNGCICCTVKDSLVTTLENLLNKRQDLDYIIIEASGMANPGPIASVFWLDDALESRLKLDGIVTLVDGVHILEQIESTEEAALQIAYADRIVLNKVDLLEPQEDDSSGVRAKPRSSVEDVERKLRQLHPTAPILRTSFSKIPNLDWILNADCFGGADRLEELERICENTANEDNKVDETSNVGGSHNHQHGHESGSHDDCGHCHALVVELNHHHTASISTIALHESGSVNLAKLNAWLAAVLWPNQDETDQVLSAMLHRSTNDENETTTASVPITPKFKEDGIQQIFRIKGIISAYFREEDVDDLKLCSAYKLDDSGLDRRRYIIQAVYDLWEVYPASDNLMFQGDEERVGKVLIIGKFLKEAELRSGFQRCFESPTQNRSCPLA